LGVFGCLVVCGWDGEGRVGVEEQGVGSLRRGQRVGSGRKGGVA